MATIDPHRVAIVSLYMDNINPDMLSAQKKVVTKFNTTGYEHIQDRTHLPHGKTIDIVMQKAVNSHLAATGPVVVMFLDVDAIPLHDKALDWYIGAAANGKLVGNAQRSNHITNEQHVYAGSPLVAISVDTYNKMGCPTAQPTQLGDVIENWTYTAEKCGVEVELAMPVKFDAPPIRMNWETDTRPYWPLKEEDEVHRYGIGTTYRIPGSEVDGVWHMFQSFHPGQLERFKAKCDLVINSAVNE